MDAQLIDAQSESLATLKREKKELEAKVKELNGRITESENVFKEMVVGEGRNEWRTPDGKLLKLRIGTYWNIDDYDNFWEFAKSNPEAVKLNGMNLRAWANAERENLGEDFDYKSLGISPYDKIGVTVLNNKQEEQNEKEVS